MGTGKFRTKTSFEPSNNGFLPNKFVSAIDIGYGGVKVFSNNWNILFPFYAKKSDSGEIEFIGETPDSTIFYKDLDTGEIWIIGEFAQNMISTRDTSDSESILYGRDRFSSPMFKVITRAAIALSLRKNEFKGYTGQDIYIETGLPEKYMNDSEELKSVLCGKYNKFALKVGKNDWEEFDFSIDKDKIDVMPQPKGSLFSVCIDRKGQWTKEARTYLKSSILVFDPGFGTLDLFPIISGAVRTGETYPDLGMKRIMQETSKLIKETYDIDVTVPAMQKFLETGMVRYGRGFESKDYPFGELLEKANKKVCDEALNRINNAYDLSSFDYIIITGGTGAAWLDMIKEKFKGLTTITILYGNQNDSLPMYFSNVRGYYLYRFNILGREAKQ